MAEFDPFHALLKLVVAVVFGGLVGWQREARDRPAGLRTHVLVCVGSAVYTLSSLSFSGPSADPGRVAAQVATGMGFLGAGTIIRHGNVVRGLTTAASLWAVAAIGICVGIGGEVFWVGGIATAVVLLTLTALRSVEQKLLARGRLVHLNIRLQGGPTRMQDVERLLAAQGATIEFTEVSELGPGDVQHMRLRVLLPGRYDLGTLGLEMTRLEGFVSMRCE